MDFDTMTMIGIALLLVLDKVLGMLKARGIDLQEMSRQVKDLHEWHNVVDAEGVKLWYVRRSLEDAIIKLSENIALETKLLDRIDRRLERLEDRIAHAHDD